MVGMIRLRNLAFHYLSLWWSLSFCYWNIIIEVDLADAQELKVIAHTNQLP